MSDKKYVPLLTPRVRSPSKEYLCPLPDLLRAVVCPCRTHNGDNHYQSGVPPDDEMTALLPGSIRDMRANCSSTC